LDLFPKGFKLFLRELLAAQQRAERIHQQQFHTDQFREYAFVKIPASLAGCPLQYLIACPIGNGLPRFPSHISKRQIFGF